ncbi:helix-turn-helix transcriptional regulator [Streptomyces parvus]
MGQFSFTRPVAGVPMSAFQSPGIPSLDLMLSDPGSSPTVLRIAIGSRLRKLREAADFSPPDASAHIRCHESKISRMECGRVPLKVRDVQDLLELYGVDPGNARRQRISWSCPTGRAGGSGTTTWFRSGSTS